MDGLSVVTLSAECYFDVIRCLFSAIEGEDCDAALVMGGACDHARDPVNVGLEGSWEGYCDSGERVRWEGRAMASPVLSIQGNSPSSWRAAETLVRGLSRRGVASAPYWGECAESKKTVHLLLRTCMFGWPTEGGNAR